MNYNKIMKLEMHKVSSILTQIIQTVYRFTDYFVHFLKCVSCEINT